MLQYTVKWEESPVEPHYSSPQVQFFSHGYRYTYMSCTKDQTMYYLLINWVIHMECISLSKFSGKSFGQPWCKITYYVTLIAAIPVQHFLRAQFWRKCLKLQLFLIHFHSFTCAPVRTTGLPRFSNMKERADAVKAIVSVPCRTTKPS